MLVRCTEAAARVGHTNDGRPVEPGRLNGARVAGIYRSD